MIERNKRNIVASLLIATCLLATVVFPARFALSKGTDSNKKHTHADADKDDSSTDANDDKSKHDKDKDKDKDAAKAKKEEEPKLSVTEHTVIINGQPVKYKATAGYMLLKDFAEKKQTGDKSDKSDKSKDKDKD